MEDFAVGDKWSIRLSTDFEATGVNEPGGMGLCSTGHFPSLAKPPSGPKIEELWQSLQKFRATKIFIIPKLLYITIKLDKLPFH